MAYNKAIEAHDNPEPTRLPLNVASASTCISKVIYRIIEGPPSKEQN